jgi:hypothetical protein
MSAAKHKPAGEPETTREEPVAEKREAPEGTEQEYVREEVQKMIESDWSNEELRSIGITRELAAELGIRRPGHSPISLPG